MIGKLYNDYTTKQEIENKMQKEATKDVSSVAHDQSFDGNFNAYKNINIRNGSLVLFTSTLYMDLALSFFIIGLYIW